MLFGLFHYVLQKNIYSGTGSSDEVRRELKGLKTHPDVLLLPGHNKEFCVALENHLNNHHQYALLQFFHPSLQELPAQEAISMALPRRSLELLTEFLGSHSCVSVIEPTSSGSATQLTITFTNGTTLRIHCLHRFHQKGLCYLSIDDLLRCRVTNGKRYVASLFFDFSHYLINQTLNHTTIQDETFRLFERRASDEQLETIWTSTKNFWMNNNSTQHFSLAANVKKYIHALPMNTFNSRVAYRLNDLKGIIKNLLRFPKAALPPQENRLAPIHAATRTRRTH